MLRPGEQVHKRVNSNPNLDSLVAMDPNRNVNWLNSRGSWVSYILIIAAVRLALGFYGASIANSWSITTIGHVVVRSVFYYLHFI